VLVPVAMSSQQQPPYIDDAATPEASVASPYVAPPSISHTVKRGETLSQIARHYRVSTKALQAWNGLRKGRVVVGQRLSIHKGAAIRSAGVESRGNKIRSTKSTDPSTITYRVRRGDTLYSIARRFDVDMVALKRWNNISDKRGLVSGTRVAIPAHLKS
jgi:membrane-bound lytic murein transglycosylase D